jgi:serine/threonine-protein kinase
MSAVDVRTFVATALAVLAFSGAAGADDTPDVGGPPSSSSTETAAGAQALFVEGRRLVAEGQYVAGCAKLDQSEKLDPAPGTLINLADCYEKSGRLATAWIAFHDAAIAAERAGRDVWAAQARDRAQRLEPRVPKLSVVIDEPVDGLAVERDGLAIAPSALGLAVPVDPAAYEIAATAPGRRRWSTKVTIESGMYVVLHVPVLVEETKALPKQTEPHVLQPQPGRAPSAGPETAAGSLRRTIGVSLGGAALVAGAIGLYFGMDAITDNEDAAARCPSSPRCTDPEAVGLTTAARHAATVSTVAFIAGGALLAAGVTVYFTAPRRPASSSLSVGLAGSNLLLGGRF